jgi:hypothetical protein
LHQQLRNKEENDNGKGKMPIYGFSAWIVPACFGLDVAMLRIKK